MNDGLHRSVLGEGEHAAGGPAWQPPPLENARIPREGKAFKGFGLVGEKGSGQQRRAGSSAEAAVA